MDFSTTPEHSALRTAVRDVLTDTYSSVEVRREKTTSAPGFDPKVWRQLAEMGLLALPFAEEDGGMEAGALEIGLVAEEIGRALAPEPFVEVVVLSGGLVAKLGTPDQRADLLTPLMEGGLVISTALAEPGRRWELGAREVQAERDGETWTLTGAKEPVIQGHFDVLLVSAALPGGGTGVFHVTPDAPGLTISGYRRHDEGQAARLTFSATPATPLGEADDQESSVREVVARAQIAYCREAIGAMEAMLSTTTDYLKMRKQFGVTLSTFQALTFRAADMYVSLELARSTALWACMVAAEGGKELTAASRAKYRVSRAARNIGSEAIQLHGGIGLAAEHQIGHYATRLIVIEHLFGDGDEHLRRLIRHLQDYDVVCLTPQDPLGGLGPVHGNPEKVEKTRSGIR